jgi:hypothetical protein
LFDWVKAVHGYLGIKAGKMFVMYVTHKAILHGQKHQKVDREKLQKMWFSTK